jgi:hypothetical protein
MVLGHQAGRELLERQRVAGLFVAPDGSVTSVNL